MKDVFKPGWISCLDKSMSIWFNRWTYPGWIFVPRKPHPFGMEWNDICCAVSDILYCVELREGKDGPKDRPSDPTNEKDKTVGLLLWLCKNLYSSGKIVVLDSGFSVLARLVELKIWSLCFGCG